HADRLRRRPDGLRVQVQQSERAAQLRVWREFFGLIREAGRNRERRRSDRSELAAEGGGNERKQMAELIVRDLHVAVEGKEILKGVNLEVARGQIHALMGPNGSGKSTFANTLMGHPGYEVTAGDILFEGQSVLEMEPDERSRAGLFMAFQYPVAIPGVSVANF